MKSISIEGTLEINAEEQPTLKLVLPLYSLSVQVIPKELVNKINLDNYWGIYVLEGEGLCYVGQSKNPPSRLNTHKATNKINFSRCFIFTPAEDKRRFSGGLDFLEAYIYDKLNSKGYPLDNKKKLSPDEIDMSLQSKGNYAKWADEFIAILPILGLNAEKLINAVDSENRISPSDADKIVKLEIEPPSSAQASLSATRISAQTQTPAKLRGFTLNGSTFKDETSVGVYRKFLLHMHSTYPDFFEVINKIEKHGKTRRYVSRTVAGLGLGGEAAKLYEEFAPGWFVGYNASDKDYKRRIVWMLEKYKPELLTSYSLV